jgi:hypothetical protein
VYAADVFGARSMGKLGDSESIDLNPRH